MSASDEHVAYTSTVEVLGPCNTASAHSQHLSSTNVSPVDLPNGTSALHTTVACLSPDHVPVFNSSSTRRSMGFQITSVTRSSAAINEESGDEDVIESVLPLNSFYDITMTDASTDMSGCLSPDVTPVAPRQPSPLPTLAAVSCVVRSHTAQQPDTPCAGSSSHAVSVIPTTEGFGISLVCDQSRHAHPHETISSCTVADTHRCPDIVEFPANIKMDLTPQGLKMGVADSNGCYGNDALNTPHLANNSLSTNDSRWHSRFKIVKIETNLPFRRSRWLCMDYRDRPKCEHTSTSSAVGCCSVSLAATSCVGHVIFGSAGDTPTRPGPVTTVSRAHRVTTPTSQSPPPPPADFPGVASSHRLPSAESEVGTGVTSGSGAMDLCQMCLRGLSQNSTDGDHATLCSDTGLVDETTKLERLDDKIKQAMDLVKSHLLLAVREEVDVLKAKISRLLERIAQLESENQILREHVPCELLSRLDLQQKQQPRHTARVTTDQRVSPTITHPAASLSAHHSAFSLPTLLSASPANCTTLSAVDDRVTTVSDLCRLESAYESQSVDDVVISSNDVGHTANLARQHSLDTCENSFATNSHSNSYPALNQVSTTLSTHMFADILCSGSQRDSVSAGVDRFSCNAGIYTSSVSASVSRFQCKLSSMASTYQVSTLLVSTEQPCPQSSVSPVPST